MFSNTVTEVEDKSKRLQPNKIKLSLVFPRVHLSKSTIMATESHGQEKTENQDKETVWETEQDLC